MWEVKPEIIEEMHKRIRPIKTDLVLRTVIIEDFKIDLPISGGWGNSKEESIKFTKQDKPYNVVPLEYQIVDWLLFEELIIFREKSDQHSNIEKKLVRQILLEDGGRKIDYLEFAICCWHDYYWKKLKTEWEENESRFPIDPLSKKEHSAKREASKLRFTRSFYFDVTDIL
jgi:hypothetical protein